MRDEGEIRSTRTWLVLTMAGWSVLLLGSGAAAVALFRHGGLSMVFPGGVIFFGVLVGAMFWTREALIAYDDARAR